MAAPVKYLETLFGLAGRTAVVTGGSSGIGFAMATALGRCGARVILIARRPEPLAESVTQLKRLGVEVSAMPCNVANADELQATADRILTDLGASGPDILVNAAGINARPHMNDLSVAEWHATMAANLTAPFLLGQIFGPRMASRKSGRIINVVSQQAFRAYGNSGAYGASKGGLVALTRSQAEAWSPHGVLCNAVAPGVVQTPLTESVFADPAKVDAHAARTMIGRNGVPSDFEGVAVYLASDASAAVTGQTIFVDGGYSAT